MRLLAFTLSVAVVIWVMLLVLAASPGRSSTARPSWIRSDHYQTFLCESAGDWRHHVVRRDGEYGGGFSWYVGTWLLDRYRGMSSRPWLASPREQYRVFLRSIARGREFGCRR